MLACLILPGSWHLPCSWGSTKPGLTRAFVLSLLSPFSILTSEAPAHGEFELVSTCLPCQGMGGMEKFQVQSGPRT